MIQTTPLENGCYYHIYNRGNNKESIFKDELNYAYFLKLWRKYISPIADTYAYCLLDNHFHSMIRIKEDVAIKPKESLGRMNLPEQQFANFFNAYAKGINSRYSRTGKLFEERFNRKLIDKPEYFTQLIYYIHANPQKHGFINDFRQYKHSSFSSFLSKSPTALMRNEVIEWFGGENNFEEFHSEKQPLLTARDSFAIDD